MVLVSTVLATYSSGFQAMRDAGEAGALWVTAVTRAEPHWVTGPMAAA